MNTKPKHIIRTRLGEWFAEPSYNGYGIYVIACYPQLGCVYIGISYDVSKRLDQHVAQDKPLGNFLRNVMYDSCKFRLDIIIPPDDVDQKEWCMKYERELVQRFRPTFNSQHLGEELHKPKP